MLKAIKCYLLYFVLYGVVHAQPAHLGIFDATADWGWEEEYTPERPWHKVPGNIELSRASDGFVYDVYGNGAQLGADWAERGYDLGYYVFVPQQGSTQFTARVQLIDRGGNSGYSMSGIMIRKDGKEASSQNYALVHRFGDNKQIGASAETNYRINNGGRKFWGDEWNVERSVGFDTAFLRLTNIQPLQMIAAELSIDGVEWFPIDQTQIELGEVPDYGLMVCSQSYSQQLAHSRFSEIEFKQVSLYTTRDMKQFYQIGEPFEITLTLVNESDSAQPVQLIEYLPEGWSFHSSNHPANINHTKIEWELELNPGNTVVTYTVIPPTNIEEMDRVYGHVNDVMTLGHHELNPIKTETWGTPRSDWQFWGTEEGLLSHERSLFVGFDGTVFTQKERNQNFIRYDGYKLQIIPTLPHMLKIVENKEGRIWSISYELDQDTNYFAFHGIYEYIKDQWELLTDEIGFEHRNWYFNFFPLGSNKLLIASNLDLVCFNADTKQYESIPFKDNNKPSNFFPNESVQTLDGTIWLGGLLNGKHTFSKIPYISSEMGQTWLPTLHPILKEFELRSYGPPLATHNHDITLTYLLPNLEQGIALYDGINNTVLHKNTPYKEKTLYNQHSLWRSKENNSGVEQIDQKGNVKEFNDDFFVGGIHDIHIAPEQGFWVATQNGVALNSPAIWQTPPEILGLNESVYSITEDMQNRVWFLSYHHLIRYDDTGWTLYQIPDRYHFEDLSGTDNKLMQLKSGLLSIGPIQLFHRWRSIQRRWLFLYFDPEKERFIERFVPEKMEAIALENKGEGSVIEITKPIAIKMYNREDRDVSRYYLHSFDGFHHEKMFETSERPNFIYEELGGSFWTSLRGNSNTLYKYSGESTTKFNVPSQTTVSEPLAFIKRESHGLLATSDCLFQLQDHTFTKLADFDGQKHEMEILTDGSLWIATDSGVIREKDQSWFVNGHQDGLLSSTVYSIFEDSQNRIWAGTASGLSLYNPELDQSLPETKLSEETNINEFTPNSEILISYTGFDQWKKTKKDRLLYSTKLNQEDWSPFTSKTIFSVTSLPRGNHTLFVRSMDRNGNIDFTPAEFDFSVQTPWYLHWGFLTTVTTLLLYIVYRHISLERTVQLRTADLQHELQERHRLEQMIQQVSEREQKRVGQDLHDGLNQYLAGTLLLIRKMHSSLSRTQPKEAEKASIIENFLEQSVQFTRNLVRGLSPISLDAQGLNDALREFTSHMKKLYEIECDFVCQCQFNIQDSNVKTNVFRIVQESVNNAIKHGKASEIIISLNESTHYYLISIQDNGNGFDSHKEKSSGFGLQIMQYRASLFHGTVEVLNQQPNGVCVQLNIPKLNNTDV